VDEMKYENAQGCQHGGYCEKENECSGFINYGEISWQVKQRSSA
jgi:hypothetical protein